MPTLSEEWMKTLPITTRIRLWITREIVRWRLALIVWMAGIDGEWYCNDETCWCDECGIDIVRFGKIIGTICYGEGGNVMWVAWMTPDGVEGAAWNAGESTFKIASDLRKAVLWPS